MKKIDLAQTIQILADIGVIASIVFLGVGLRQNNDALNAQSRYNHALTRSSSLMEVSGDEGLAAILTKAQQGQQLDAVENHRLQFFYMSIFVKWQWEFGEGGLGRIEVPANSWRTAFRESSNDVYAYPGIRAAWEAGKSRLTTEFVAYVEENVIDSRDR